MQIKTPETRFSAGIKRHNLINWTRPDQELVEKPNLQLLQATYGMLLFLYFAEWTSVLLSDHHYVNHRMVLLPLDMLFHLTKRPQKKELTGPSGNQLAHCLHCSGISCTHTVDLFHIFRSRSLWIFPGSLFLMTGQSCLQQDKKQREFEPLQVHSRFWGSSSPRSHQDVRVRLGWRVARSTNCKHGDPLMAYFRMCRGKGSKQALAAGVSDVLEAWKKRNISCMTGAKDYLGSSDVHGLRTQQ